MENCAIIINGACIEFRLIESLAEIVYVFRYPLFAVLIFLGILSLWRYIRNKWIMPRDIPGWVMRDKLEGGDKYK